jgi:hypothetical protein
MNMNLKQKNKNYKLLLAMLVIITSTIIFFFPVIFQKKICAPLDIVVNLYEPWVNTNNLTQVDNYTVTDFPEQYYPYMNHMYQSYRNENFYGWNYLKYCGTPAYANTMSVGFSWRMQLFRFLPFWTAWHIGITGQYLIALIGMFLFLRDRRYSFGLALLGAISFAFSTFFSTRLYHLWAGGLIWTPWIFWGMYKLKDNKKLGLLTPFSEVATLLFAFIFTTINIYFRFIIFAQQIEKDELKILRTGAGCCFLFLNQVKC